MSGSDEGLILAGGYIVTMDAERRVLEDGAIAIKGGDIVAVGPVEGVRRAIVDAQLVDVGGALVLPGLIDGHHHPIFPVLSSERHRQGVFPQVSRPGVWWHGGDIDELLRWASRPLGWPLDEESAYLSALVSLIGRLKSGVTCVVDGGTAYADQVSQAAIDLGIRITVAAQCQDLVPSEGGGGLERVADADELLAATEATFTRWTGAGDGRVRVAGSLFWPIGCSDELCAGMRDLARRSEALVVSHVAALANEPEASLRYHGRTPFDRLDELGLMGPALVAAHAGFPTEHEITRIATCDTRIAHVPATSTFGMHGIISAGTIPRYVDAGVRVILGTDGPGVPGIPYMLASAASFHKDVTKDGSTLDAPAVLEMATSGAARAIGWDHVVGSIEPGKSADLVVVDRQGLDWEPDLEPVGAFISGAGAGHVSMVIVAGRTLVQDGRMTGFDEVELTDRLRSVAAEMTDGEGHA